MTTFPTHVGSLEFALRCAPNATTPIGAIEAADRLAETPGFATANGATFLVFTRCPMGSILGAREVEISVGNGGSMFR